MADNKQPKNLELRANLPRYFRAAAVGLFILAVIGIGIGFYSASGVKEFRMVGFPTSLSKDVVAEVSGYERRESEGDSRALHEEKDVGQSSGNGECLPSGV